MSFFSRSDWGARKPKSRSGVAPRDRKEFFVHYSTGEELGRDDCAHWVKEIQNYHMDTKGWSDIAYNFLVCKHGDIFEGRGWDVIGAHNPDHNTIGIGVCFLGDDDPDVSDAPEAARAAIRWLADEADRRSGRKLTRLGHRDTRSTSCPGNELHAWVHAGMPLVVAPAPEPATEPAPIPNQPAPVQPAPAPQPAPSTEPDWTGALIMNLPTLKKGASGLHVRILQGLLLAAAHDIKVDGSFGPNTDAHVKAFQAHRNLTSDGVVGPKTWRALLAA